jgi:hypothetical protein
MEKENGKKTGNALVLLSSPTDAARAKAELHKKYMGKRYIEVLLYSDILA